MRFVVAVLTMLLSSPALSQNYRDAIDQHILIPCVRGIMAMRGESTHQDIPHEIFIYTVKKTLPQYAIDTLHTELGRSVAGKQRKDRMTLCRSYATFWLMTSTGQ